MNRVNPSAIAFWVMAGCIGYLIGDTNGAVIGVLIGTSVSLIADILD